MYPRLVVAQRPPDLHEALHQRVVGDGRVRPDGLHQLLLGDQPAGVPNEVGEDVEALRPEPDLAAVVQQRAARRIEDEAAEGRARTAPPAAERAIAPSGPFTEDFVGISSGIRHRFVTARRSASSTGSTRGTGPRDGLDLEVYGPPLAANTLLEDSMRNACAWLVLGCTLTLGLSTVEAQTPLKVVIGGLKAPGKMLALETGAILVSESGTGVHDSRVTAFDTDGNRLTLIEGLPSGLAFPNNDPSGASGLALRNHTLYIAISAGDSGIAGPVQGSEIPNPNKSSPIFSSVLALEFDRNLSGVTAPFRVTPARPPGARAPRARGARQRAGRTRDAAPRGRHPGPPARTASRLAAERARPRIRSRSNRTGPCALWLVDASRNLIWKVDICENTFSTLTTFPPTTNPTPAGPPRIDAVPTSARTWNGDLLVSFLSGAPFLQGLAQVRLVKTVDRRAHAVLHRTAHGRGRAAVRRRDATASSCWSSRAICWRGCRDACCGTTRRPRRPVTFADGLVTPVNMAIDPRTGDLLISQLALGRVVALPIGR